jgi:hypothetical protein
MPRLFPLAGRLRVGTRASGGRVARRLQISMGLRAALRFRGAQTHAPMNA